MLRSARSLERPLSYVVLVAGDGLKLQNHGYTRYLLYYPDKVDWAPARAGCSTQALYAAVLRTTLTQVSQVILGLSLTMTFPRIIPCAERGPCQYSWIHRWYNIGPIVQVLFLLLSSCR